MMRTAHSAYPDLRSVPQDRRLPDFFILGAPKCGTTTLFDWLSSHPGTYLPNKEPNFLSCDVVDLREVPGAMATWDAYLDQLCPSLAAECMTGEATPRYLYSDLALDILARFPQPPHLLILLRNPIDLVFSLHGQMVKQGDELETHFEVAWQRALERGPSTWYTRDGRCDSRLDYSRYGLFAERIEKVFAMFPASRVKVMILEESLGPDPTGSYGEVLSFLGLPPIEKADFTPKNRRADVGSLAFQGHLSRLRRRVSSILHRLGVRKGRGTGIMRFLTRLNRTTSTDSAGELSAEQRRQLADFFSADVARLEKTLGRSIGAWRDFGIDRSST